MKSSILSSAVGSVLFLCSRTLPFPSLQELRKLPAGCAQELQQHALRIIPAMLQICSFTLQLQMLLEMLPLKGILQISIPLQLVICSFLTFCYLPPGKCANISMQIPAQSSLFLNTNYNLQMRSGFKTAISICKPKSYAALAQPPAKTSDLLSGSLHLLNISMSSST